MRFVLKKLSEKRKADRLSGMRSIWERYHWLILFTGGYLFAASFAYARQGNKEFMGYLGVTGIVAFLVLWTIDRTKLDRVVLWGLSIAGCLHMLGGLVPVDGGILYDWEIYPLLDLGNDFYIIKADQLIHLFGYGVAGMLMYQLIADRLHATVHRGLVLVFAWSTAVGIGVVNEVIEFFAFLSLDETGVGDYFNTLLDLIFNILGALAGAFIQQRRTPKSAIDFPAYRARVDQTGQAAASGAGRR